MAGRGVIVHLENHEGPLKRHEKQTDFDADTRRVG